MPRRTREKSDRNRLIAVDRFEHVSATPEYALLRLEGRYRERPGRAILDAALLVGNGLAIERHAPLADPQEGDPDLAAEAWLWRVAFSVPEAQLRDPRTTFAIEAARDEAIELPWPVEHAAALLGAQPELPTLARRARPQRLQRALAAAVLLAALAITPSGLPAAAKSDVLKVRRADGTVMFITRNVPHLLKLTDEELKQQAAAAAGAPIEDVSVVPSEPEQQPEAGQQPAPDTAAPQATRSPVEVPTTSGGGAGQERGSGEGPASGRGERQDRTGSREAAPRRRKPGRRRAGGRGGQRNASGGARPRTRTRVRRRDGSPTRQAPGFFDALPGPSRGVPNFVIRKFRVPIFLLPIYQAAGIQYGIRWEILAAINEIETDYGRNLNVSSAGALGWMQFMPATWRSYGVDANKDGRKDPYNPVDAIFAAARYLKAGGYDQSVRRAIFAYNHADWYVDSVLMRARLISGVPSDVVGSLTGLTEGRFPVAARARYADDLRDIDRQGLGGRRATRIVESSDGRREIEIFAREGSPVVAVNDGVVKKIGRNRKLGRYVVLQDVYGNQYTYAGLDSVARLYPVPKDSAEPSATDQPVISANDPKPTAPASAGRQLDPDARDGDAASPEQVQIKRRLFAHPSRPNASKAGGFEQMLDASLSGGFETYSAYFAGGLGLDAKDAKLKRLRIGSHVVGSTILGRVGRPVPRKASHLRFSIRPAGRGAPTIDPKPILDGWKLLESTAIYRASGRNVLYGEGDLVSIGQILLLPKSLLEKRVLSDERIDIYPGGRRDIKTGQIDRRVLATLAYLAESGLRPTVSSLKSGHGYYTSTGNVSHHATGNAVDISRVNGIPILGHQERGGITEQTVRRLMMLQGTMQPAQIISLLDLGRNTLRMGDHHDHIHVGWRPLFGANRRLGRQAEAVLKPGQWEDLIARLRQIRNPVVPTRPSRYATRARRRASHAHRGD